MKKERLKPGPKPKDHVRFHMWVTESEKEKCIAFYKQLKKDRINNIEVTETP